MDPHSDWLDSRDNARQANRDYRESGVRYAVANARYYRAKALAGARLKARGYPATYIDQVLKGQEEVNEALLERDMAKAEHDADRLQNVLFNQEEAHTYDQLKRAMAGDTERF